MGVLATMGGSCGAGFPGGVVALPGAIGTKLCGDSSGLLPVQSEEGGRVEQWAPYVFVLSRNTALVG